MMAELHRELVRRAKLLAKEESGVALMLTLSVFLMLYVACAGVYAIGETVRQKIELQNACDSAAYSAAVVQADGLSRMAMVNRALSWTYVQLTNLQMDYITYRWLKKARDNFREDRNKCEEYNRKSTYWEALTGCNCEKHYRGKGKGWFCGVSGIFGSQSDKICMNGKVMDFDSLDQLVQNCSFMEEYGETIKQLKNSIDTYNTFLPLLNTAMQHSIPATASATLYANLPQTTDEEGNSEIDRETGKDFLWYVKYGYSQDPYDQYEADSEASTYYGSYFSPLYNTEAGERIFLTMADGACYDRLEPYFSNGNAERMESGGLDQWFIRSYPEESAESNRTSIPPGLWQGETGNPKHDSYKAPGICRVYKNANREEGGKVLRGHHTGTLLLDTPASCVNKRDAFPEQCGSVDETVALCAEYEWAAAQMHTFCFWKVSRRHPPVQIHTQFGSVLGGECRHFCCCSSKSHTRNGYRNCYISKLLFGAYEVMVNSIPYKRGGRHSFVPLETMIYKPYGFARIYGDDPDIYDKETYTGTPAKPWVLNDSFYSTDGAIIVGLARRQRNPFLALFDSLADGLKDRDDEVKGIYSAFNPVTNAYVTAFSAARAAHRFHPSAAQWKVIQASNPVHSLPDRRDYETRYDAVCHDDPMRDTGRYGKWTESGYKDGNFKLWLDCPNEGLRGMHVGCVCKNEANKLRFARCWNLCEADWDATLLPVAYAQAGTKPWFDSYLHNKDAGGGKNEQGNVYWKSIEEQKEDADYNPFEDSAVVVSWLPFFDADGELVTDEGGNPETKDGKLKGSVDGRDVLQMKAPLNMPGEKLGLSELIKQRIL